MFYLLWEVWTAVEMDDGSECAQSCGSDLDQSGVVELEQLDEFVEDARIKETVRLSVGVEQNRQSL